MIWRIAPSNFCHGDCALSPEFLLGLGIASLIKCGGWARSLIRQSTDPYQVRDARSNRVASTFPHFALMGVARLQVLDSRPRACRFNPDYLHFTGRVRTSGQFQYQNYDIKLHWLFLPWNIVLQVLFTSDRFLSTTNGRVKWTSKSAPAKVHCQNPVSTPNLKEPRKGLALVRQLYLYRYEQFSDLVFESKGLISKYSGIRTYGFSTGFLSLDPRFVPIDLSSPGRENRKCQRTYISRADLEDGCTEAVFPPLEAGTRFATTI